MTISTGYFGVEALFLVHFPGNCSGNPCIIMAVHHLISPGPQKQFSGPCKCV
jgi:hypothetical protein